MDMERYFFYTGIATTVILAVLFFIVGPAILILEIKKAVIYYAKNE